MLGLDIGLATGLEYPQPPVEVGLPDDPHGDGWGLQEGLEQGLPDMLHPDLLGKIGKYLPGLNPLFPFGLYRGAAPGVNSEVLSRSVLDPGLNPESEDPSLGMRGAY